MQTVAATFFLTAPLFLAVVVGFGLVKLRWVPPRLINGLSKVIFTGLIPALLFHLLSDFSRFPPFQPTILVAFFGGCLVVFGLGRLIGPGWFGLNPAESAVLGIGGVFSNNVMLGLPLAQLVLGPTAVPTVALVLAFNSLILWTLVTVAVEWSRQGSPNLAGLRRTLGRVAINPVIIGIGLGLAWGLTGWKLPAVIDLPLGWISQLTGPLALIALGMSLATYNLRGQWRTTVGLTALKLVVHPLAVWALAVLVGLPSLETRVLVLLASIALGSNVYLMARQFGVLEQPASQSLLLSTIGSAVTTPLWLSLIT